MLYDMARHDVPAVGARAVPVRASVRFESGVAAPLPPNSFGTPSPSPFTTISAAWTKC